MAVQYTVIFAIICYSPLFYLLHDLLLTYIFAHLHILEGKWKIQISADHRDLC